MTDADRKGDVLIEVTEMREEPVVGKQERVVEEVVISKTAEERTEKVRDTVRRKDVEVENPAWSTSPTIHSGALYPWKQI